MNEKTLWTPLPGTLDAVGRAMGATGDWQLAQMLDISFDDLQAARYGTKPITLYAAMAAWRMLGQPLPFLSMFAPYESGGDRRDRSTVEAA